MRFKLHEVELYTKDPSGSRKFYEEVLGFKLNLTEPAGLNVFDSGWPGVDFDTSVHQPGKSQVSFITDDLPALVASLKQKGIRFTGPTDSHLGLQAVSFEDPEGHVIVIQCLTEKSPPWLKERFTF